MIGAMQLFLLECCLADISFLCIVDAVEGYAMVFYFSLKGCFDLTSVSRLM